MENLKREKVRLILSAIVTSLVIIVFGWLIAMSLVANERSTIYKTDNFLVDIQPNIKRKLDVITNLNIKGIRFNRINITNNGNDSYYKIVMSPIGEYDIKVGINDTLIRDLSSLKMEDGYYVIYEGKLSSSYTAIFNIKLWLVNDNDKDKMFNFKLKVIEENSII